MKSLINLIIYVYNNEKEIKEIIENGKKLTDQIIIIDLQSKDQTVKIAQKLGAKVYLYSHPEYVELAREWGIKKAESEWVFILDADEKISKELVKEIKLVLHPKDKNANSHFYVPRKNIFIDRWLKHGGWWPDYQIRLINTHYFVSWPKKIHSTPIIKGKKGYLKNPLLHYFHGNLEAMVKKTIKFENIEADLLLQADKEANVLIFFRKFFGEIWRRMFKNLGFLDGRWGIIESIYQSFSKTITYLFLYEKKYIFKK